MDHHRAHLALTPHALTSSPNKGRAHRMTDSLFRRKPIVPERREGEQALVRTLGWPHWVALGVGSIVGPSILTLIGGGADKAGPAVIRLFRSEEPTFELQSLMRCSYDVFC